LAAAKPGLGWLFILKKREIAAPHMLTVRFIRHVDLAALELPNVQPVSAREH
jgi:hypothetical protein